MKLKLEENGDLEYLMACWKMGHCGLGACPTKSREETTELRESFGKKETERGRWREREWERQTERTR